MSWDPFQREVLAELGHVLYRQAGAATPTATESALVDAPHADATHSVDSMLIRIARAAGMTTEALQACLGDMHVIDSLHGNASAKRALWPQLRALRRR
ncbi:MAG: hypothetical protein M3Q51_02820 [Pseudomonadota bacterium]|nr:hypothetical protein [Pseudomonadota bacterium]MDQ3159937.1 hypothetical protein [Pseudomonadota bacterium]